MDRLWGRAILSVALLLACVCQKAILAATRPDDQPLAIVALASVDRILARFDSLRELGGFPGGVDAFFKALGDDDFAKILTMPGLDTRKPIGMMSYPGWSLPGEGAEVPDPVALLESLPEMLASGFAENATVVLCFPATDQKLVFDSICKLFKSEKEPVAIEGMPGWVLLDDELRIGNVGNYVYAVVMTGKDQSFDYQFPEFDKLARRSLGTQGFVYAVYREGLPPAIRDVLLPAFQAALTAAQQRRDDEAELNHRLRTAFGPMQDQMLELLLTQTDEIRITGHVDASYQVQVNLEFLGPKGGKLAKACNLLKLRANPFQHIAAEDATIAATVSVPLPRDHWKPLLDVIDKLPRAGDTTAILRTVARTVETGQLDLCLYQANWSEGLLAIRVQGGAEFPELFSRLVALSPDIQRQAGEVDGFPVHRSLTSLESSPVMLVTQVLLGVWFGGWTSLADMTFVDNSSESLALDPPGDDAPVPQGASVSGEAVPNQKESTFCYWLAATPQSLWIGYGPASETVPDWFSAAMTASREPGRVSRRSGPLRFTVRGLGASPPVGSEVQQVGQEPEAEMAQGRGDLLRDFPNAVHCDFQPTETGARLSFTLEEGYCRWYAKLMADTVKASSATPADSP